MEYFRPLSKQECIDFCKNHLSEMKNGKIGIQIDRSWGAELPDDIMHIVAQYGDVESKKHLAYAPNTSAKVIEAIVDNLEDNYRDNGVCSVVLNRPHLSEKVLQVLARNSDKDIRRKVASHPDMPSKLLENLTHDADYDVPHKAASNTNMSKETLEKLARSGDKSIRIGVAGNPNTPPHIINLLAEGCDEYIGRAVARNTSASVATLEKLAWHPVSEVRETVASNPSTPSSLLEKLSEDDEDWVKYHVACNPNTPVQILKKIAYSKKTSFTNAKRRALEELEKRGIKAKSECFIATAVYASPFAPDVIILKKFRDDTLLQFKTGRHMIDLYYRYSPSIAKLISTHNSLRFVMKYGLVEPFVKLIALYNKFKDIA